MQFLTQIEGNPLGPLRFDDVAILVVDEILPAVDIGLAELGAEVASGADADTAVRLVKWLSCEERAEPILGIAAVLDVGSATSTRFEKYATSGRRQR